MNRITLLTAFLLLFSVCNSQDIFKWDRVDSISKTKAQIYSDTKMFITKT